LVKLKNNGLEEQTVKIIGFYLNHLAVNVNLNPESVKEFIANKNVDNGFKGNLVKAYNFYAMVNNIVWERPRYRWEQNKPKIPGEEALDKIIASCGWKYSVVFTLLKETGAMPKELNNASLRDIDFERETIAIRGRKGHSSRTRVRQTHNLIQNPHRTSSNHETCSSSHRKQPQAHKRQVTFHPPPEPEPHSPH